VVSFIWKILNQSLIYQIEIFWDFDQIGFFFGWKFSWFFKPQKLILKNIMDRNLNFFEKLLLWCHDNWKFIWFWFQPILDQGGKNLLIFQK
jgi:hypothetical protein